MLFFSFCFGLAKPLKTFGVGAEDADGVVGEEDVDGVVGGVSGDRGDVDIVGITNLGGAGGVTEDDGHIDIFHIGGTNY